MNPRKRQERAVDDTVVSLAMPTLGQVAVEARFASLRPLLATVADAPVDQLSPELRDWLKAEAATPGCFPVALAFFAACDAAQASMAEKRARVAPTSIVEPGELPRNEPRAALCSLHLTSVRPGGADADARCTISPREP